MALNQLWPVIGVIQEEIKVLWDSHDARVLLFFLALVALLIFALILRRRSELAKRASMADPSNPTHVRKRDAIYSLGKDVVESGKVRLLSPSQVHVCFLIPCFFNRIL